MAITFPRTMPAGIGASKCVFEPVFTNVAPRTNSAALLRIETADAFWSMEITFSRKMPEEVLRLRTWIDSMQGGLGSYLCHDYARPLPRDYAGGLSGLVKAGTSTPFDGTCAVSALAAYSIGMTGLPANFQFREGDYVGLVQSGKYGLHQITEDVAANVSGAVTVPVIPAVQTNIFTTSATANVNRALAEFVPLSRTAEPAAERTAVILRGVQKL